MCGRWQIGLVEKLVLLLMLNEQAHAIYETAEASYATVSYDE